MRKVIYSSVTIAYGAEVKNFLKRKLSDILWWHALHFTILQTMCNELKLYVLNLHAEC